MGEFYRQIDCDDDDRYSVVIEDDGKVAYAYLLNEGKISGDVWLYNNGETPATPPWKEGKKMPFANPAPFVDKDNQISPLQEGDDLQIKWNLENDELAAAFINIRGKLVAKIQPGSKPGWSTLVIADGPLAKVLK